MSKANLPLVCAVMLVDGRPEMVRRAVASFHAQTYPRKRLMGLDTGAEPQRGIEETERNVFRISAPQFRGQTIGQLRNEANKWASWSSAREVMVHWDSDDWSHPNRIEEQVNLLQCTDAQAVGYSDMLFWHQTLKQAWVYDNQTPGYCLGTSLCYYRHTWEKKPFEHTSQGEDARWCMGLKTFSVSSMTDEPRMICSIHDSNTSNGYTEKTRHRPEWYRVPGEDEHCRKVMKL